jgi:hypothetical protein
MPLDGTALIAPLGSSFAEAAIALMLHRGPEGPTPDLLADLRALAEARGREARLWDTYTGGRLPRPRLR